MRCYYLTRIRRWCWRGRGILVVVQLGEELREEERQRWDHNVVLWMGSSEVAMSSSSPTTVLDHGARAVFR
jgi:hypothetical protein